MKTAVVSATCHTAEHVMTIIMIYEVTITAVKRRSVSTNEHMGSYLIKLRSAPWTYVSCVCQRYRIQEQRYVIVAVFCRLLGFWTVTPGWGTATGSQGCDSRNILLLLHTVHWIKTVSFYIIFDSVTVR